MSVLKKLRSAIVCAAALGFVLTTAAHAVDGPLAKDSNFFFRYRGHVEGASDPAISKDIVAYFIGAVGKEFSEKLPIKAQWLGLTWKVVNGGELPAGITFDNSTRLFTGIPTEKGRNLVVDMIGYRADGVEEATAQINFDIFDLIGEGRQITLYAHTGKYKYDALPLPTSVVVDKWLADPTRGLPPGISVNGPYFEGVPTKAGVYPVYIEGMDYLGKVVVSYLVNYVVEDGPSFGPIPDDVRVLAPSGTPGWHWSGYFDFGAPSPYAVNYAIDPSKKVRYFLRIDEIGKGLPGSVSSNSDPYNLNIKGFVTEPYQTVKAHFHAIDSDGTSGDSNTFTFGTADPTPVCKQYPYAPEYVTFYTGMNVKTQLALPFGNQGTVKYTLISGDLPQGLSLEDGGRLVGVPMVKQPKTPITVRIELITAQTTLTADCNYDLEVKLQPLTLTDATPAQNQHGRVGASYQGAIKASGVIPDYTINWTAGVDHPTLIAQTPAKNQDTVPVSGAFEKAEKPGKYNFTIVNGDTNVANGDIGLFGYDPLSFGTSRTFVPNFAVKRLESGTWGAIPYDALTVVPDTSGAIPMPVLVVDEPGSLPSGIGFDGRRFVGMTGEQVGQFGPFRVTMSDYTGEKLVSDPFYVDVADRDPNVVSQVSDQVFVVEQSDRQSGTPPTVIFPAGAAGFRRSFEIHGPSLPSWARFDRGTGVISADAGIPFGDLAQPANQTVYGPYTITVSDDDPAGASVSKPSAPFNIRLVDMAAAAGVSVPPVKGTVSGDADAGVLKSLKAMAGMAETRAKTVTSIRVMDIEKYVDRKTIVGTVDQVVFTHSEPASPAGIPLQVSADGHTAFFDGTPTEAFEGEVKVWFKDVRGRTGAINIHMEIRNYPTAAMTAAIFDLPRLAPAADYGIATIPCDYCWTAPTWEVDPIGNPLPPGLTLDPSGFVKGSTDADDDQTPGTLSPFAGIVLKATSKGANGENIVAWTEPFQINVRPRVPMTLDYPSGADTWYLNDKTDLQGYTFNSRDISTPKVGGSHVPAVTFDIAPGGLLSSQGMNGSTGVFAWDLSSLQLGEWSPLVTATDSEGQTAPKTLKVKATLEGDVRVASAGGAIRLRQSEAFATGNPSASSRLVQPILVKNKIEPMRYEISGSPGTVLFDRFGGTFLETSRFDEDGMHRLFVSGQDADGRGLDKAIYYSFEVFAPLAFSSTPRMPEKSRQYAPGEPLSVTFPRVLHVMDTLEYAVEAGSAAGLPGTVVYKNYDSAGVFGNWSWVDPSTGAGNVVDASDANWKSKLPLDALVFDPADRTLKGIPSKHGTFVVKLVVKDTYRNTYLHMDDVNYAVERRLENNTAVSAVTAEVSEAYPLKIVNVPGSSEDIAQYTQRPSIRAVVENAAYGLPLDWTKVSGDLPKGFYAGGRSANLDFGGFAEERGTFQNIVFEGVDRAGRAIRNDAVGFTVGERQKFEVVASENPKNMAVFLTDSAVTVEQKHAAYDASVGKANWTVTGKDKLPPGVSVVVEDRVVRFTGKSDKIGEYGPVVVAARDKLGATASISLTFNVRIPDGAIVLDVENIRTKKTFPFQMQATASNTYGIVEFNSYAIPRDYSSQMQIDMASGLTQGKFSEPLEGTVDVWVTDETNRVTSKPVTISVLPFLRLTVPQIVKATETLQMEQEITTDYVLGTVSYEKGAGSWPQGLSVDPATGKISGKSTSVPATYKGLTIKASDTWTDLAGTQHVDTQESNVFDIALDGIPDIADVASSASTRTMLFTKDVAASTWKPTVTDAITKKAWDLQKTVYSTNKDFEFDTGLSFDVNTGEISGTPTKLVIYTDLTITVVSPHGNSDTTKPFWFAVQPQGSIWAQAGQKDEYRRRVGTLLETDAPIFENTVGTVAYKASGVPAGMAINASTGVLSGTPTSAGDYNVVVTATDGASRTASFPYVIKVRGVMGIELKNPVVGLNIGQTYGPTNAPTVVNPGGVLSFSATGLPAGMTLNGATGAISGSPSADIPNDTKFAITVKAENDFDDQWREIAYTVTVALPILPEEGQRTSYNLRRGQAWTSEPPVFTNAVGAVRYSIERFNGVGSNWDMLFTSGYGVDINTGVISGNPDLIGTGCSGWSCNNPGATNWASGTIRLTVTDSTGRTGSLTYAVKLYPKFAATLSAPVVGIDFDRTYSGINRPAVSNFGGAVSFSATGLPAGLSVNPATGALEGTVASGEYAVGDSFPVVVTAEDSYDGSTSTVGYTLTVADAIKVVEGQVIAYPVRLDDTLTVDLPKFENTFGAVTYAQSGRPGWMSFDTSTGASTGRAISQAAATVTVTATDSLKRTATFQYTVTARPRTALSVSPTVDGLDFGKSYPSTTNRPSASNVIGTARFEDVDGKIAAAGLSLDTAAGGISGTVDATIPHGTVFQPVVRMRDSYDDARAALIDSGNVVPVAGDATPLYRDVTYRLTVAAPITAPTGQTAAYSVRTGDVLTVDLPKFDNIVGTATYSQSGKPSWLGFSTTDGAATGTAGPQSSSTVTVTVKDSTLRTATFTYTLNSRAALGLSLTPTVNGIDVGKVYGSTNRPTAAAVSGTASFEDVDGVIGGLGLTFDTKTGGFSGTLSSTDHGHAVEARVRLRDTFDDLRMQQVASGNVAPPVSDPNPDYREVRYPLTVANPITVPAGQKLDYIGRVGDKIEMDAPRFEQMIGAVSFKATSIPSGFSIDPSTGILSGTVSAVGNYATVVTATDSTGRTATLTYRLVTKGVLAISLASPETDIWQSSSKPYVAINRPLATNVGASVSFDVIGLPPEFSFSAETGAISGVIARGVYTDGTAFPIKVVVTDSFDGNSKELEYSLIVRNPPTVTIAFTPVMMTTNSSHSGNQGIPFAIQNAKAGDVVSLAPGSQPLPPGFVITNGGTAGWRLMKTNTVAEIGVYRGINVRITDTDGVFGDTGEFDLVLSGPASLAYANQTINARAGVPLAVSAPVPSSGQQIEDVRFAFSTDTTGGALKIDAATGSIAGTFSANGTNVVTVTESYDGVTIRTFTYSVVLNVTQLSVSAEDFAGMTGVEVSKPTTVYYAHSSGRFSLGGQVPAGLAIDATTGTIRGVPTNAGVYDMQVIYEDDFQKVVVPIVVSIIGDTSKGHQYWKVVALGSGQSGPTGNLNEIRLVDAAGNDVTSVATKTGSSLLYDGNVSTVGSNWGRASSLTFAMTFDRKIELSKAVISGKSGHAGSAEISLSMTFYWSDDGVTWTAASNTVVMSYKNAPNITTFTATIKN